MKYHNLIKIQSHKLRNLFDLQYRSICTVLQTEALTLPSNLKILDYGAGDHSYQCFFSSNATYETLDIKGSNHNYSHINDVSDDYDLILMIEVIEHLQNQKEVINQLVDRLKPEAELWISSPLNARIHQFPIDYSRPSIDFYHSLINQDCSLVVKFRGSNFHTIANKCIYLTYINLKSTKTIFLSLVLIFPTIFFWVLALVSEFFELRTDDPLGFFVKIKKN